MGAELIQIKGRVKSKVGRKKTEFVLFRLARPVPDDCLRQEKIRALVQGEQPTFWPLSEEDVYHYARAFKARIKEILFALGSWGYGEPPSEGGLLGTHEIHPGGEVRVAEHWCLGGPSFAWSPETVFIMKVRPAPSRKTVADKP